VVVSVTVMLCTAVIRKVVTWLELSANFETCAEVED
jgi:hypothetical protein